MILMTEDSRIVLDVWSNEGTTHLARFIRPLTTALELAARELLAGFMVNLGDTIELAGVTPDFDSRAGCDNPCYDKRTLN